MHYYLYKVTNSINNKIYIGVHKTRNLDDGYRGSGKRLIAAYSKYGLSAFNFEIMQFFNTEQEMYQREAEIVNEAFLQRNDVYNLKKGGEGGWYLSNEIVVKRTQKIKGQKRSVEQRKRISESKKGDKNPCFKKTYSEEEKNLWSKIMKEKARRGVNHPCYGTHKTEEARQNLSEKNKKAFLNRKKITCNFCNKVLLPNHYARYHGEKCKLNVYSL